MIYSKEVEEMCPVAQGVHHGCAPIPRRSKMGYRQKKLRIFPVLHTVLAGVHLSRVHVSCTLNVKEGIIQEASS